MPDLSGLGDLVLTVGGDISPLTDALGEIPAAASQAASQIQAAFDALPSATEEVNQSLANLSSGLQDAGSAAGTAAGQVAQVPPVLHDTAEAAKESESSLKIFSEALMEIGGGILTFEGLREAATKATEAFGEFQRAGEALTIVSKDAQGAAEMMEKIPAIANYLAVSITSLEDATVKFSRFGVSLEVIPGLLQAAADAARASHNEFESVASAFERMDSTGKIMVRSLLGAGLQMADVAKAMDMVGASDKEVIAAFAQLGTGAEGAAKRAQVLIDATASIAGTAHKTASDVIGSWQQITNSFHEVEVAIGKQVDGFTGLAGAVGGAMKATGFVISEFLLLVKDVANTVVLMAQVSQDALTGLAQAVAAAMQGHFREAADIVKETGARIKDDWKIYTDAMAGDTAKTTEVINGLFANSSISIGKSLGDVKVHVDAATQAILDHAKALAAIQDDYETLKQKLADAEQHLKDVNEAVLQGIAGEGQLEAAIQGVVTAQTALNGVMGTARDTMRGFGYEHSSLVQAIKIAEENLKLATQAYAEHAIGLAEVTKRVDALKTAREALNGVEALSPEKQVAKDVEALQENLRKATDYLDAMTDAYNKGTVGAHLWNEAQKKVDDATYALTGHVKEAADAISASAPKVIEVADAVDAVTRSVQNGIGPIDEVTQKIQILTPAHEAAASAATHHKAASDSLKSSLDGVTGAAKSAGDAAWVFANSWKTAADVVANASKTIIDAATRSHDATVAASQSAMQSVESLAMQLDRSMAGPNEGGGTLGLHVSLRPGDVVSGPSEFFTPPGQFGGTETGSPGGGLFGPTGPTTSMLWGTPEEIIAYGRALSQSGQSLNTAATNLNAAAVTQQDAAQAAYDAAKAAQVGAQTVSTSMTNAADSISASALAAADAANTAAFNNSELASTVQQTAGVVASIATIAAASTALVSAVIVKAGPILGLTPGGSNAFTSFSGPSISLPNLGPGGANTMTMNQPFQGYYQPTVGGTGPSPVQLNVNGSQFVQQLMDEFIRNMQSQGIRLTRA